MTYLKRFEPLEKRLVDKYGVPKGPIIAIGGLSGTGKDTAAKKLRALFLSRKGTDLPVNIAGEMIRAAAKEAGYKPDETHLFVKHLEKHDKGRLDSLVEEKTIELAISSGCGIYVGRMAPLALYHLKTKAGNAVLIWMETDPNVIAARLQKDKDRPDYFGKLIEEIKRMVKERDDKDTARFKKPESEGGYGLDPAEMTRLYKEFNNSHCSKDETAESLYEYVISKMTAEA